MAFKSGINGIAYHLLVLSAIVALSTCRPQNSIDSQDASEYQPNLGDIRSYYSNYPSSSQSIIDNIPLAKLQMLVGQIKSGGGAWDNLYRVPEMKRQIRYRQCYFNPISCFRK